MLAPDPEPTADRAASPSDPNDVLARARDWSSEGRKLALATVVQTWGSSPCPAGSRLLADGAGAFVGSVSGGCVEGAVVMAAREVIEQGVARQLRFGVAHAQAIEVGLACGGQIEVYVEPLIDGELLEHLHRARLAKRTVVWATGLDDGAHALLEPGAREPTPLYGSLKATQELWAAARSAARLDRAQLVQGAGGRVLLAAIAPPLRMAIVGAVHIAQPLAQMASVLGFDVSVIDPRGAFATVARFPGVRLIQQWPGPALASLVPDARTAVVTLTHDAKLDEPALLAALNSDAFYVGALGSRRTHAARIGRLRAQGLAEEALSRICGPIGLPIGARSPAEIATSIVAEVVQVLRTGAAAPRELPAASPLAAALDRPGVA